MRALLEVVSLDPLEVEVTEEGLEAFFVDCPRCGYTFEVSEEDQGQEVECPECGFRFIPDWSEIEEEDEEW